MSDTYSQGDIFKWVKTFDNKGIFVYVSIEVGSRSYVSKEIILNPIMVAP